MTHLALKREKLTIQLLGKGNFYTGLAVGIGFTLLFYFLFTIGRDLWRGITTSSGYLLPLTNAEILGYNFFFAAVSLSVGFGVTAWFWFHNPFTFKHTKFFNQFIRVSLLHGVFILLIVVLRTSKLGLFLLYVQEGYDDQLSFIHKFPELLILLPSFFFLHVWTPIRLKFRVGHWFYYSILIFILGTAILGLIPTTFSTQLDRIFDNNLTSYVQSEVARAKQHNIIISQADIAILQQVQSGQLAEVAKLAQQLKARFLEPELVPPEAIVTELILVKVSPLVNLSPNESKSKREQWPYAFPKDVYRHLAQSPDSVSALYLKELLAEYKAIFPEDPFEYPVLEKSGVLPWKPIIRSKLQVRYSFLDSEVYRKNYGNNPGYYY